MTRRRYPGVTMMCLRDRCAQRWYQSGTWDDTCPFCGTDRILPVTPLSEEIVR